MYIDPGNKSRSLGGTSDLTVLAPIKKGLVPSLDAITYKTRVSRLLEALQLLRESSHEYSLFRPVSDSSERVARIHSFRVAIVEPEDKLLLAVTFDGAQASYMRVLWQKIGTLLDLLFCSTEGYVSSHGHTLAEWAAWIDRVQVGTDFFYSRPWLTSEDVVFLRDEERERQLNDVERDADLASVRRVSPSAEMAAWELSSGSVIRVAEAARQGIQTVAVLHRLTNWFIPDTPDGGFLHRAARDLLPEFRKLEEDRMLEDVMDDTRERFDEALDWFFRPYAPRNLPAPPLAAPDPRILENVQGGILGAFENVTHGALLLLAFKPEVSAQPFWDKLEAMVTRAHQQPVDGRLVCNVALTVDGLRAAGLKEDELAAFPLEFREGMAARSSVLGDFRANHPRRWTLPVRNWRPGERAGEPVELSAVHVMLQLRIRNRVGTQPEDRVYDLADPRHPLHPTLEELEASLAGCMEFLSREPMVRHLRPATPDRPATVIEHFGYADGGASNPVLDPAKNGKVYQQNLVQLGEILLGYPNAADHAPAPPAPSDPAAWLTDGSFCVIRKLRQDVAQFNAVLANGAHSTGLSPELIAAKLMGRDRHGVPLAAPATDNDFDYKQDAAGEKCPLHAHIRRANPRSLQDPRLPAELPGARPPRIMRRGMSYGLPYDAAKGEDHADNASARGMFFMAYNASIAEQFEVVQRWLAGGNSTGGYSGRSDPFLGVAPSGERRIFSFEHPSEATVARIALDGSGEPAELARPIVRLEWGLYLFSPSIAALARLKARAAAAHVPAAADWPWSARRGRAAIDRLLRLQAEGGADARVLTQAWKALLEDPDAQKDYLSASVWASIRQDFAGVLHTPYGVVVAGHDLVMQVLRDAKRQCSVSGYRERATATIGDIYLGLDDHGPGCPYRERATRPNRDIMDLARREHAFERARALAAEALDVLIQREKRIAQKTGSPRWELSFTSREVVDRVLEGMSREWFGLPLDGPFIKAGAFRWDWEPGTGVLYPGSFAPPSRYIFQPRPGDEVLRFGSLHGRSLRSEFRAWVKSLRDADPEAIPKAPDGSEAPLAKAIFETFPRAGHGNPAADDRQDTLTAETMLGALIGFLPTVDGNLRQSMNEWLKDGTFWSLRAGLSETSPAFGSASHEKIRKALHLSMQLRPSAELIWRTAARPHAIGGVQVDTGDTLVLGLVSATHELLERGDDSVYPIFGGNRRHEDAPTHACPAYEAAMGVMLGTLTALLETKAPIRPAPLGLSFSVEGRMDPPQDSRSATRALDPAHDLTLITAARGGLHRLASENIATGARALQLRNLAFDFKAVNAAFGTPPAVATAIGQGHWLLLEGDSWFNYPASGLSDIADHLQAHHKFRLPNLARPKERLSDISLHQVDALCDEFNDMKNRGTAPLAILISAGGNDVTRENLTPLVRKASLGHGLDGAQVAQVVDGTMRGQLSTMLSTLKARCRFDDGAPVPVFLLGYDYPVPDGRNIFGVVHPGSAWLRGPLSAHGYDIPGGTLIMRKLIDRLNDMQAAVCAESGFGSHVFHADLRGTLSSELQGDAYRADWDNELHPTRSGFEKITRRLVTDHLGKRLPALQPPPH